jgi:hypothetical protein
MRAPSLDDPVGDRDVVLLTILAATRRQVRSFGQKEKDQFFFVVPAKAGTPKLGRKLESN